MSQLNLSPYSLLLLLAMILLAFIGKLAAGLVVSGTWRQKLIVGSAMVPRGEVGLVFAEVGRQLDIIPAKVFTELVLVIAITTLLGPLLLRRLLPKEGEA